MPRSSACAFWPSCAHPSFHRSHAVMSSTGGSSGIAGSGPSGAHCRYASAIRLPPSPSIIVWWVWATDTSRPGTPSTVTPSKYTARHGGASSEIGRRAHSAAQSRTARNVPSPGAGRVRRCSWVSNPGTSTQRGSASDSGSRAMRRRIEGRRRPSTSWRCSAASGSSNGRSMIEIDTGA